MPKRVAVYVRVSTDEQTVANQIAELEATAQRHGWHVVEVFRDQGISGAKGRDQRPGFDRLLKAIARRDVDMVAAWSVDRLGRSLRGLVDFLTELQSKKIDLFLHQQGLDTTTPGGRAMFGMLSVFAEFERDTTRERIAAGLKRARREGVVLGRPKVSDRKEARVRELLGQGAGMVRAAKLAGCGVSVVQRVKREMSKAA